MGRGLDKCYPDLGFKEETVKGLEISANTIVYYYTYGSVLAALSRPRENRCDDAMQIFDEVMTELNTNPDDYTDGRETIVSIVQAGESICDSLARGDSPISSAPTQTGDVIVDLTATPTP